MAAGKTAKRFKRFLIFELGPVVVATGVYLAGAPWYLALAILVTAQYWYGPVVIYFRIRMPRITQLEVLASEQDLPPEQSAIYAREEPALAAAGFRLIGRYENPLAASTGQRATGLTIGHIATDGDRGSAVRPAHALALEASGAYARTNAGS